MNTLLKLTTYKISIPVVPLMINLPENNKNMRTKLNIAEDSIVYGRHGGYDEFNIQYVHKIVYEVARKFSNIYFLSISF